MFYTYLWLREDGTPYYVGKGSNNRAFISWSHGVHCPPEEARIIVQEFVSENEAFEAEKFLIDYFGRLDTGTGCLRNLTEGGENPPNWQGKKRSEHHRLAMKQVSVSRQRKLWQTPDYAKKMIERRIEQGRIARESGAARTAALKRKKRIPVTHCKQGHEYTVQNTWVSSKGQRKCRECRRKVPRAI